MVFFRTKLEWFIIKQKPWPRLLKPVSEWKRYTPNLVHYRKFYLASILDFISQYHAHNIKIYTKNFRFFFLIAMCYSERQNCTNNY